MPFGDEVAFQFHEVFNNAVMHDDKTVFRVAVRMRVDIRRASVRRPTRMTDTDLPVNGMRFKVGLQVGDAAYFFTNLNLPVFIAGDPRRIIAAVFQFTQTVN